MNRSPDSLMVDPTLGIDTYEHGFLPLAASYLRALGVEEIVNTLVPSQMDLKPGTAVLAMVLDTLQGRHPLYQVGSFVSSCDQELLFGRKMDDHQFTDSNLGRSLDAIFTAGTGRIITALGVKAAELFSLDLSALSYDTTSTSVWGEYRQLTEENAGPHITWGHSKDLRPDLKQFMTELLTVERGIPIYSRTLDGNASDKKNNLEMLRRIGGLMKQHGLGPGAFVYVADSAAVTAKNLEEMGANQFITRLPANYTACKEAIHLAMAMDEWQDIGSLRETAEAGNRRAARYRSYETTVTLHGQEYRAIVFHSDALDARRSKAIEQDVKASLLELKEQLQNIVEVYHCEADALKAATAISAFRSSLHFVEPKISTFEARRRGRPAKDGTVQTETRYRLDWTIQLNEEKLEKRKLEAGCFVLLTNVPRCGQGALESTAVLQTYKGQYGVERDFAFLKDPLIVNDLFLKTPSRIDALGLILVIALMVYRLMERSMRLYLKQEEKTVLGLNNIRTARPTTYALTTYALKVKVLVINGVRYILKKPSAVLLEYLEALGLDDTVYSDPRSMPKLIIPRKEVA